LAGALGLSNPLFYTNVSTTTLSSNSNNLASVAYANGIALQGAPTATNTTPGIVQVASLTQLSNGIAANGSYQLVPPNSAFNYTPQNATGVPVSNASGKINQSWLDLTANWNFTGTTTLAATTTSPLIIDGVTYIFPNIQGSASTTLINNGSGKLTWGNLPFIASTTNTFINSTWNGTTATQTLASLTITPPIAEKVLTTGVAAVYNDNASDGCILQLYIDNNLISNVGRASSTMITTNFSYLTNQLSSAPHTLTLTGIALIGGTCHIDASATQFNAFYAGN